jgi:hypothetical protein
VITKPRKLTPALEAAARRLRAAGWTYAAVGRKLGVGGDCVRKALRPICAPALFCACGKRMRADNPSGLCGGCRARQQRRSGHPPGRLPVQCKASPPGHAERMALYAERAAGALPLFTD